MQPPVMTAEELAEQWAAPVRVTCYRHGVCLFAGNELPEGGAAAVAAAAGCPDWSDQDPAAYDDCPVPEQVPTSGAPTGPHGM